MKTSQAQESVGSSALLILIPVIVLPLVGGWSLYRDWRLSQREAYDRAHELCQQIADRLHADLERRLFDHLELRHRARESRRRKGRGSSSGFTDVGSNFVERHKASVSVYRLSNTSLKRMAESLAWRLSRTGVNRNAPRGSWWWKTSCPCERSWSIAWRPRAIVCSLPPMEKRASFDNHLD